MIRDHIQRVHHAIDRQPLPIRGAITLTALLSLPVLVTAVRTLGRTLGLAEFVLPLLALAHVPLVVVLVCIWSIGCDVCTTEGAT